MTARSPAHADGTDDNAIPLIGCGPDEPPGTTFSVAVTEYTRPARRSTGRPGASATLTVTR